MQDASFLCSDAHKFSLLSFLRGNFQMKAERNFLEVFISCPMSCSHVSSMDVKKDSIFHLYDSSKLPLFCTQWGFSLNLRKGCDIFFHDCTAYMRCLKSMGGKKNILKFLYVVPTTFFVWICDVLCSVFHSAFADDSTKEERIRKIWQGLPWWLSGENST